MTSSSGKFDKKEEASTLFSSADKQIIEDHLSNIYNLPVTLILDKNEGAYFIVQSPVKKVSRPGKIRSDRNKIRKEQEAELGKLGFGYQAISKADNITLNGFHLQNSKGKLIDPKKFIGYLKESYDLYCKNKGSFPEHDQQESHRLESDKIDTRNSVDNMKNAIDNLEKALETLQTEINKEEAELKKIPPMTLDALMKEKDKFAKIKEIVSLSRLATIHPQTIALIYHHHEMAFDHLKNKYSIEDLDTFIHDLPSAFMLGLFTPHFNTVISDGKTLEEATKYFWPKGISSALKRLKVDMKDAPDNWENLQVNEWIIEGIRKQVFAMSDISKIYSLKLNNIQEIVCEQLVKLLQCPSVNIQNIVIALSDTSNQKNVSDLIKNVNTPKALAELKPVTFSDLASSQDPVFFIENHSKLKAILEHVTFEKLRQLDTSYLEVVFDDKIFPFVLEALKNELFDLEHINYVFPFRLANVFCDEGIQRLQNKEAFIKICVDEKNSRKTPTFFSPQLELQTLIKEAKTTPFEIFHITSDILNDMNTKTIKQRREILTKQYALSCKDTRFEERHRSQAWNFIISNIDNLKYIENFCQTDTNNTTNTMGKS